MPCFSSIKTRIKNAGYLGEALRRFGYAVTPNGEFVRGEQNGRRIMFQRGPDGYYSASGDTSDLTTISKAYAEIGVRDWAKRRGMVVEKTSGNRITFINRRG